MVAFYHCRCIAGMIIVLLLLPAATTAAARVGPDVGTRSHHEGGDDGGGCGNNTDDPRESVRFYVPRSSSLASLLAVPPSCEPNASRADASAAIDPLVCSRPDRGELLCLGLVDQQDDAATAARAPRRLCVAFLPRRESTLGGGGASVGQRDLVGGAAVVGALCLALLLLHSEAARKRRSPLPVVAPLLLLVVLLLVVRRVGATTLEAELASYSCYDPSGASCSCSGTLYMSAPDSPAYTGTIPAELSACTGLTALCVLPPPPTQPSCRRGKRVSCGGVSLVAHQRDTGVFPQSSLSSAVSGRALRIVRSGGGRSGSPSRHDVPARNRRRRHTRLARPEVRGSNPVLTAQISRAPRVSQVAGQQRAHRLDPGGVQHAHWPDLHAAAFQFGGQLRSHRHDPGGIQRADEPDRAVRKAPRCSASTPPALLPCLLAWVSYPPRLACVTGTCGATSSPARFRPNLACSA